MTEKTALLRSHGEGKGKGRKIDYLNILSGIFNLTNGLIGAGVLSYPFTFRCTGIAAGISLTLLAVALTIYSLSLLSVCSKPDGSKFESYEECVEVLLGRFWSIIVEIAIITYSFGITSTYMLVIGQFIKPVVDFYTPVGQETIFNSSYFLVISFSVVFIFPLLLIRKISYLGFTSFIAIIGALYLSCFIIFAYFFSTKEGVNVNYIVQTDIYLGICPSIFLGIPIIVFGFQTHQILFPVLKEIRTKKFKYYFVVIVVSVLLFSSVFLINGLFGYMTFGESVQDNILNNYPGNNVAANIGRVCIGLTCMFSAPIMSFCARSAIQRMVGIQNQLTASKMIIFQVLLFAANVLIALFVPGLAFSLSFIGAVSASLLMFLLPAVFLVKVHSRVFKRWRGCFICSAVGFVLVFLFCITTGVFSSVLRIFEVD